MTGDASSGGIDEQGAVGANAGNDASRRLGALPADGEVATSVARELVVRERARGVSGGAKGGHDRGKHLHSLRTWREARTVEAGGRAHVDTDADGDPVESGAPPPRLDEDARELSLGNVDVVGPLEASQLTGKRIERGRDRQGEPQSENA